MIEAEKVEHSGVEVGHGHRLLDRSVAELIGGAVNVAAAHAPAIQKLKPLGLWSRPSLAWLTGRRPNSPAQMTSVSSRSPHCLRSRMTHSCNHLSAVPSWCPHQMTYDDTLEVRMVRGQRTCRQDMGWAQWSRILSMCRAPLLGVDSQAKRYPAEALCRHFLGIA